VGKGTVVRGVPESEGTVLGEGDVVRDGGGDKVKVSSIVPEERPAEEVWV